MPPIVELKGGVSCVRVCEWVEPHQKSSSRSRRTQNLRKQTAISALRDDQRFLNPPVGTPTLRCRLGLAQKPKPAPIDRLSAHRNFAQKLVAVRPAGPRGSVPCRRGENDRGRRRAAVGRRRDWVGAALVQAAAAHPGSRRWRRNDHIGAASQVARSLHLTVDDFGIEVEISARIARQRNLRIYEIGISYFGCTYAEGKKINWKDGLKAPWYTFWFRFR
jgi:hypothetical protein